jgi:Holliday junction DNA helicase RuvA
MYAYLSGKFAFKSPTQVFLDVNGVGYEVNISLHTYEAIQNMNEGKLFTHLQIKEDAHTLFGFFEKDEKDIFLLLISVSGVGASTARMMLSSMKPDDVAKAITQGNAKVLENVKGIGKKTAERLVLELKDKVGKQFSNSNSIVNFASSIENDALIALTGLGISKTQAEQSIQKIIRAEPNVTILEELIKKALKAI